MADLEIANPYDPLKNWLCMIRIKSFSEEKSNKR